MADAAERVVLAGQDAIDLWQQGRDVWNAWVAENPVADIDFSGVDFSKYGDVSFASFRFPNGKKISQKQFLATAMSASPARHSAREISFFSTRISVREMSASEAQRWTRAMSNSGQRHLGWGISISNMPI